MESKFFGLCFCPILVVTQWKTKLDFFVVVTQWKLDFLDFEKKPN